MVGAGMSVREGGGGECYALLHSEGPTHAMKAHEWGTRQVQVREAPGLWQRPTGSQKRAKLPRPRLPDWM